MQAVGTMRAVCASMNMKIKTIAAGRWRWKSTFSAHLQKDINNPFQGLPALEKAIGRKVVARIGSNESIGMPRHPLAVRVPNIRKRFNIRIHLYLSVFDFSRSSLVDWRVIGAVRIENESTFVCDFLRQRLKREREMSMYIVSVQTSMYARKQLITDKYIHLPTRAQVYTHIFM